MHPTCPHACRLRLSQWHAPGASRHRFRARLASPLIPLFSLGSRDAHIGFLRHAHPSTSRVCVRMASTVCTKKSPSSFVADLSDSAASCDGGDRSMSPRILHQQNHGRDRSCSLGPSRVRLHQRPRGDIVFLKQTIQRHGLFPGVHLGGQGGRGILGHAFRSFHGSRCRDECHPGLARPLASPAQRSPVQNDLCVHLPILADC